MPKIIGCVVPIIARKKIQPSVSIGMISQLMDCISKRWLILAKVSFAQTKSRSIRLLPVIMEKYLSVIPKSFNKEKEDIQNLHILTLFNWNRAMS